MKITKLETVHVLPRWMFLRLYTDEGIVGYGEPVLEGKSAVVAEAVNVLGKMIIGEDPMNIEHLWQRTITALLLLTTLSGQLPWPPACR